MTKNMNLRHQIELNTHFKPSSPVSVPISRRKPQQQLHFQQFIFGRNIAASPIIHPIRTCFEKSWRVIYEVRYSIGNVGLYFRL